VCHSKRKDAFTRCHSASCSAVMGSATSGPALVRDGPLARS